MGQITFLIEYIWDMGQTLIIWEILGNTGQLVHSNISEFLGYSPPADMLQYKQGEVKS
jgi:hypothetical protein